MERLSKQLLDSSHREKESSLYLGQVEKPIFPIERNCQIVFGVRDNTCGGRLFTQSKAAVEGVHQ